MAPKKKHGVARQVHAYVSQHDVTFDVRLNGRSYVGEMPRKLWEYLLGKRDRPGLRVYDMAVTRPKPKRLSSGSRRSNLSPSTKEK